MKNNRESNTEAVENVKKTLLAKKVRISKENLEMLKKVYERRERIKRNSDKADVGLW